MLFRIVALCSFASLFVACSQAESPAAGAASPDTRAAASSAAPAAPAPSPIAPVATEHRAGERPLPNLEGRSIDGKRVAISSLIGKRFLLFFFNPEVPEAKPIARAVNDIAKLRDRQNFEVLGIAVGSSGSRVTAFARDLKLDFTILDDSNGLITRQIGLRSAILIIGADKDGYMDFVLGNFDETDPYGMVQASLHEKLRIPLDKAGSAGALDQRPLAPDFTAVRLDDGKPYRLSDRGDKPAVLIFFLHTCPHCHKALAFLKKQLAEMPEAQRPELIAISAVDRGSEVKAALREAGLDFFPVLLDPGEKIQAEYGVFKGFPDVLILDAEGRIHHRAHGWHDTRDPALIRMKLAKLAGLRVPMLLNPRGYTGSDVCGVCHELEYDTWQYTKHASAFDTLVKHGADRDPECVGCHVVGFEKPGGFGMKERPEHLEDVGCESCHDRGGPHLSPGLVKDGNYAAVCETCHNPEHSLGFSYDSFRPSISHTAIAALSNEERAKLLSGRSRPGNLLPTSSDFVGSQACESCHAEEFATWVASPHARAGKTLEAKQKGADPKCLACHTTGFGRPGGFAEDAHIELGSDLSRVGCESCHGPGAEHVKEGVAKIGSIVSLGDKCDSCVILKVCGSCHDPENDPDFEFQVQEKIDRQRHGTTEAGSSRKLESTLLPESKAEAAALLAPIFEATRERS